MEQFLETGISSVLSSLDLEEPQRQVHSQSLSRRDGRMNRKKKSQSYWINDCCHNLCYADIAGILHPQERYKFRSTSLGRELYDTWRKIHIDIAAREREFRRDEFKEYTSCQHNPKLNQDRSDRFEESNDKENERGWSRIRQN